MYEGFAACPSVHHWVPGACRGQKALPLEMVVNHVGAGNRTPSMPLCLPSPCLYFKMQTRQHPSSVSDLTKRSPHIGENLISVPGAPNSHRLTSPASVPCQLVYALLCLGCASCPCPVMLSERPLSAQTDLQWLPMETCGLFPTRVQRILSCFWRAVSSKQNTEPGPVAA